MCFLVGKTFFLVIVMLLDVREGFRERDVLEDSRGF